ncbi:MAG: S-layer homology domain-containing protein [Gudongella sp.]|nr:S-layer homology domain-containing protein [Gudongella sp.]
MKKHLALVLALVMVLSSFSFVSAAPDFSDLDGHENAEAVARLELLNVLKGYPDGTFKPDNTITRAEFAAVAVRVSGLENVAMAAQGLPTGFTDVPAWHWASGYVGTAAKMGIVNGIGNGLFAPETPVKYEEAITMIVRALGYEPMAQARGGYPFGYLIVANEIDLLEDAMGTQGTWATRAFVAQITDNALEIPMMIQVGFGSDTKWVISGEEDTKEKWLLDQMGFEVVEGVVEVKDVADMEIEIDGDDYVVPAGFDFFMTEGAEIKAWVDGDDVFAYTINDDVYLDAIEVDGDEIELMMEDETFDLARDAQIMLDGADKDGDFTADFAKVVVNGDDEVSFVEAYVTDGFILVEEIDDEIILDINDDEVDVEDYVVLKDGMTASIEALEEGDVVFFYDGDVLNGEYDGLAMAFNESVMGEISRVYTASRSFRMNGENYELVADALYLDDAGLSLISNDVEELEWMMDEETEAEAFLNFEGDVVLVVGDTGEAATSKFYAVLIKDAVQYDGRGGERLALDLFNEFGEKMELDIDQDFIDDGDFTGLPTGYDTLAELDSLFEIPTTTGPAIDLITFLFEVEVDEDGDLETLKHIATEELAAAKSENTGFEIDDTYAEVATVDNRLMSSTVVFYDYDSTNGDFEKVVMLGDVDGEFSEVETGRAYAKSGRVEVVLATSTDADTDTTDYTGLVKKVRTLRGGEEEITIMVAGEEMEFVTADKATGAAVEGEFWTLTVGDTSKEIDSTTKAAIVMANDIDSVDVSDDVINLTSTTAIELVSDAVVYEYEDDGDNVLEYGDFDEVSLRDVKAGSDIGYVLARTNSNYWVSYVVVYVDPTPAGSTDITMAYDPAYELDFTNLVDMEAYTVRIKTASNNLPIGDAGFTADGTTDTLVLPSAITSEMADGITYTAELYKTSDLTKVLKSINFTADIN